jgi:hypothetical protein
MLRSDKRGEGGGEVRGSGGVKVRKRSESKWRSE